MKIRRRVFYSIVLSTAILTYCQVHNFYTTSYPVDQNDYLFVVTKRLINGQKYGYINQDGRIVIPLKFDHASSFSDGLASIRINKQWGFVDRSANVKFVSTAITGERDFPSIYPFLEGLALVEIGGLYGYIDKSLNIVIKPQFFRAGSFREGLAEIQLKEKGKYGFINKQGEIVISPQFDNSYGFSEGLAPVQIKNRWGYINKDGDVVIEPKYANVQPFSEGLAAVKISHPPHGVTNDLKAMTNKVLSTRT